MVSQTVLRQALRRSLEFGQDERDQSPFVVACRTTASASEAPTIKRPCFAPAFRPRVPGGWSIICVLSQIRPERRSLAIPTVPAGHAVIEAAVAEGVTDIFSLLGHANLAIIDGFYGREDVRYIGVRHEQAGALMADGYARASGRPGVFIATCGPGTTNVVTAAAAAQAAQSPLVIVGGGTPEEYAFRDAFQEFDLVSLLRPVTKFAGRLTVAERIPEMMRHLFRVATSGKKGPVFLELPEDQTAAGSTAEVDDIPPNRYRLVDPRPEGDSASIQAAAATLKGARRPVLLAGGGVVWGEGTKAAVDLADLLGAALVTSYARNDALPNDHPRFLGALGRAGAPEAVEAVRDADVLLALGTRLAHMTGFFDDRYVQASTRIIQVEIDASEIGRNYPVEVGILGDARAVAVRLLETLRQQIDGTGRNQDWQRTTVELAARRRARLETEAHNDSLPVKPQRVYGELRKAMPPDAIYTLDAGAVSAMAYDRLHFTEPKTFFSPLYIGSLGVGLPLAMGAKVARPDKAVLSINGDGGFLFNSQELQTAIEYGINVVAVVMNNNSWGGEKNIQAALFDGRIVGADISNPRYDKYAEVFGAKGFYAEHPDQIADALKEALSCGKPAVVEIPVDPTELGGDVKM